MAESIKVEGLGELVAGLDEIGQRSFTRAAADSLTGIAFMIQRDEKGHVQSFEGGPVSFTSRAFLVEKASFKKDPIESAVAIQSRQSEYLSNLILGGARERGEIGVTGGGALIPETRSKGAPRLTAQGNLPEGPRRWLAKAGNQRGGAVKYITNEDGRKVLDQRNTEFVGKPKGFANAPFGVYRRLGDLGKQSLSLIAVFTDKAKYEEKTFDFFGIADERFQSDFEDLFKTTLDKEIKKLNNWR